MYRGDPRSLDTASRLRERELLLPEAWQGVGETRAQAFRESLDEGPSLALQPTNSVLKAPVSRRRLRM